MIHLSEVDMMKTKTIKTPLMMAEAYSLSVCPSSLALESKLSRNLESHTGLVPRLSHHEWQKPKKQSIPYEYTVYRKCFLLFLPLMMSLVAKQRVMMSGLVRELAHRHKAMTSAPKREAQRHQQRGFLGFCS